ncbi:Alpha/Beta hydrolase protein [Hygrophoropsis aurantiaca]|uniref:Alpha/Beta hydrolase protein n=1 Tax=Hygrophoropsis aurantiaca TaxID=72124 RepID=A0ACB8AKG9_9AGAM|nr:Alpha/Beta hydrolase protein [Hygrophoropsis aurantiaca]
MMNDSLSKTTTTKRGLKYRYYYSHSQDISASPKPVLLLVHGYGSTAQDWGRIAKFFVQNQYSIIAPDLLGLGGTDKPLDVAQYVLSKICQDIMDILDVEQIKKVVAIGHDWGSKVVSRLANFHSARFEAFAFLAVSYVVPTPNFEYYKHLEDTKAALGYVLHGYWEFLAEEGAAEILEEHWDSSYSLGYPHDPKLWSTHLAPVGGYKEWLLNDNQAPLPSYLTEEDKERHRKITFENGGMKPGLNWYKTLIGSPCLSAEDDKLISPDSYNISKPTFFGGAEKDFVCLPAHGQYVMNQYCKNYVSKTFDADHWLLLSHPEEVATALIAWLKTLETNPVLVQEE